MARKAGQLISRDLELGLFAFRLDAVRKLELGNTTIESFMAHSVMPRRT